jgi:Holliday junction DNA helicase RuvA
MIHHVSGTLVEKSLTAAVVEVGGLGLQVQIPLSTFDRLPREGEAVRLLTVLHVREDAMLLFGFASSAERQLFTLLTNIVTGVGPKLALSILSAMAVDSFCSAIASADLKALARIPGIGKRTAERLVVELKGKLDEVAPAIALGAKPAEASLNKAAEDAVAALISLGAKQDAAYKAVRQALEELPPAQQTTQHIIRRALASGATR